MLSSSELSSVSFRMANYPVGLGNSRINILVMDESEAEPVVMTIYTLHIYRESRPSLPMFDEYVMCSFVQVCATNTHTLTSPALNSVGYTNTHICLRGIFQHAYEICYIFTLSEKWSRQCGVWYPFKRHTFVLYFPLNGAY